MILGEPETKSARLESYIAMACKRVSRDLGWSLCLGKARDKLKLGQLTARCLVHLPRMLCESLTIIRISSDGARFV